MYTHIAKKNTQMALLLSSALLLLSLLIFAVGFTVREKTFSVQFLSIIPFSLFVLVLNRYVLTDFEYTLDGELFTVREIGPSRSFVSVRVDASLADSITEITEKKQFKALSVGAYICDCRPNLFKKGYAAIKISHPSYMKNGKPILILIEPDKKMLHMLTS